MVMSCRGTLTHAGLLPQSRQFLDNPTVQHIQTQINDNVTRPARSVCPSPFTVSEVLTIDPVPHSTIRPNIFPRVTTVPPI